MVAFHYPPYSGGSGVHRTLKFSRYLPQYGWQPIVLTANPRAYIQRSTHQLEDIPAEVIVKRAFALDTARHLSFRRSYIKTLALPDRWVSWCVGGIPSGLSLVRKYKPQVIWSTYPIATAHLLGFILKKMTGLPWVADFRDSMTEENYPRDPLTRRYYQWIEQKALRFSSLNIFTAPSTIQLYLKRYSWLNAESCLVISNGYDEQDFQDITIQGLKPLKPNSRLRLLHAGVVYPHERNPEALFRALSELKKKGTIDWAILRVEFRGAGSEQRYSSLLLELQIHDIVRLLPPLPYRESLHDCAQADGLLLLQGASCNHQIPAKVYEYLRLQKPILALTDQMGDTAKMLSECGGATILDMQDTRSLCEGLPVFFDQVRKGNHPVPSIDIIEKFSREAQAKVLAQALTSVCDVRQTRQTK